MIKWIILDAKPTKSVGLITTFKKLNRSLLNLRSIYS